MSSNDDGANSAGPRKWRRSFLATRSAHTEADSPPVRAEKIDPAPPVPTDTEEDDIPVLTDRVAAEEEEEEKGRVVETPTVVEAPVIVEVPAPPDREGIEALAVRLTQAIDQQMAYELPMLVEASLLNAVADLRAGITSTVDTALRDFFAYHEGEILSPSAPPEEP